MKRTLLLLAFAVSTLAGTRESFVFVNGRYSVTNGAPVSVKAVKARYEAPFFWFTSGAKTYLVTDDASLRRVEEIYRMLFDLAGAQVATSARQLELAREQLRIGIEPREGDDPKLNARRMQLKFEQNRLAQRQNELARLQQNRPEKINEVIEKELSALANELVANGLARPVH
jgi:hypothetical protein